MRSAVLLGVLLALGGCEKEEQYDGIGRWHIGKTKLEDHGGATCQKEEGETWCPTYEKIDLGGQKASVELYFGGEEMDAPLVEILLAVGRCRPGPLREALRDKLGAPQEEQRAVLLWRQKAAVIVGTLPLEDGTCEISFLDPGEEKRIAKLKERGAP